jgi:hypothetical protein
MCAKLNQEESKMNKCPQCNQIYINDDVFCVNDGTTLMPYFDGGKSSPAFSVSIEVPTQVVARPPQTIPPKSSDASKWLYLVIGAMSAIILGMGVVFFLSLNPKEKETANIANPTEETSKYENVSSSNKNTPKITNEPTAPKPEKTQKTNIANTITNESNTKSADSFLSKNFNRTYEGTVNYDEIEMRIRRSGSSLNGKVIPKYRSADISVNGSVSDDGSFEMHEYSDIGVVTGVYRGQINGDGTMDGTWSKPDGSKPRPFFLRVN